MMISPWARAVIVASAARLTKKGDPLKWSPSRGVMSVPIGPVAASRMRSPLATFVPSAAPRKAAAADVPPRPLQLTALLKLLRRE